MWRGGGGTATEILWAGLCFVQGSPHLGGALVAWPLLVASVCVFVWLDVVGNLMALNGNWAQACRLWQASSHAVFCLETRVWGFVVPVWADPIFMVSCEGRPQKFPTGQGGNQPRWFPLCSFLAGACFQHPCRSILALSLVQGGCPLASFMAPFLLGKVVYLPQHNSVQNG